MTIASEISRLQCAKADICTAIENKGVTVGNITIDNYACCINDIPTGSNDKFLEVLVVGGGGVGGLSTNYSCGGGGGAGGLVYKENYKLSSDSYSVVVGAGGERPNNGGNSCFGNIVAYGGGAGGFGNCCYGCANSKGGNGGSGGGGGTSAYIQCSAPGSSVGCFNYGSGGQQGYSCQAGGGGGAGGIGSGLGCPGPGLTLNMNGTSIEYSKGGGSSYYGATPTCYGEGGRGKRYGMGTNGYQGIVIVRYPTDGSYGITSSTGGNTCRTCTIDGITYCIHEFTSNGTFTVTG